MPKLSTKKAKKVAKAKSEYTLIDAGQYRVQLESVDGTGRGAKGPYWTWMVKTNEGRKFRVRTSLSEEAEWKLRETFEAFGGTTDSDTDDLIGNWAVAEVIQTTAQQGTLAGQLVNEIASLSPDNGGGKKKKGKDGKSKAKSDSDDEPPF